MQAHPVPQFPTEISCQMPQTRGNRFIIGFRAQGSVKDLGMGIIRRHFDIRQSNQHQLGSQALILDMEPDQVRQLPADLLGNAACPRKTMPRRHLRSKSPRHFLGFKHFKQITLVDVVEVFDAQAAFETFLDFARIILETLQRIEFASMDDHIVAQYAH